VKISREAFNFILAAVLDNRQHITSEDLQRIAAIVERSQAEVTPPVRRPKKQGSE
jgi:hypothetical protein